MGDGIELVNKRFHAPGASGDASSRGTVFQVASVYFEGDGAGEGYMPAGDTAETNVDHTAARMATSGQPEAAYDTASGAECGMAHYDTAALQNGK